MSTEQSVRLVEAQGQVATSADQTLLLVARIWSEVLAQPDCPLQEGFLELGGDSISATQVISRVRDQFQVTIALTQMFDHMTIERMARLVGAETATQRPPGGGAALTRIEKQDRSRPLHASHCQRRMWLIQQFAPESTAYNVPFAMRLKGPLDRGALADTIQIVWSRHEVFRTRFAMTPEGLLQTIDGTQQPVQLLETDLGAHPEGDQASIAAAYLQQSASTPFDLTRGELWRCHLLRLNDDDHILAWIAHHIIIDLWSNLILARELAEVYSARCSSQPIALPAHAIDCADHAQWQLSPPLRQHLAPQMAYWLGQLRDLTPLAVPTDHPATPHWYKSGRRITCAIPPSTLKLLAQRASSGGHSPFMIVLACLNVLLARQTRQTDIAVATPIANRQHPDTEHLVGSLVNTLVMRNDLAGDLTFADLLGRVKDTALQAYANQDLPFDLLVEKLGHQHRQFDAPLGLSVMLNVPNAAQARLLAFGGLATSRFLFDRGSTQFPLTFVVDTEQTHNIFLEYADTLFSAPTAQALVDNYLDLLNQVLAAPEDRLSSFKWLSTPERDQLHRWNRTAQSCGSATTVTAMINERARQQAAAVAVSFAGKTTTYGELHAQARHIAQSLQSRGIGSGHRIGLCLERGPQLLASVWGIWLSGAAYVPLDPNYPAERLQYMAADAKLSLVITNQSLESRLAWPPGLELFLGDTLETDACRKVPPSATDASDASHASNAAYVIYTSGSTGQPKGVVVSHRAVVNFLNSMSRKPGLAASDRLLAVTTLSFDISVLELFLPLCQGAQIIMASQDEAMDGHALQALMMHHHVSVMQATPSTWRLLLEAGWAGQPKGFKALVGGEPLNQDLALQLLDRSEEVWNMYGPTETTVWSSSWRVTRPLEGIRIGHPIANTQIWILDEHGHQCPIGVPGEIVIGGEGVASGYWNREALTDERFVPDTFGERPNARMYRTGDLGRWLSCGELEHLGRLDSQIKVRGHRIEPGEIETQLARHPCVARAVVIAREDLPGDVRIVAYVTPRKAMPPTAVLREHARHCLPDHMQPQHYIELQAIPLLANGKVDRQSLPAPKMMEAPEPHAGLAPSLATDTQKVLALIWHELLGVDHIRASDNFFDLGGHSLLAVQAIAKMEKVTGKRVSARRYIFETLAQLATSYDQAAEARPLQPAAPGPSGLMQRWRAWKKR